MVRPAKPADVPAMLTLIRELAAYEREPDAVTMTAEQLSDALFRSHPHLFGHVVEVDGAVVGLALWFLNFNLGGHARVYLEDLYVVPSMRGNGAGRALLSALADVCLQGNGYARLELSVLDWNLPAIGFYRSIGAVGMDDWTVQRVGGDALAALARG